MSTKNRPRIYALILAGGGGTRLWPVSRKRTPKHILPFIGSQTLLQTTYARVKRFIPSSRIFIVTNVKHKQIIQKQIPLFPKHQLLLEPEKRDTAAAIGFGAAIISRLDPDAVITTVNSDHFIRNEKLYRHTIELAGSTAYQQKNYTVLIGVNPTYAETGYGYIKMGERFEASSKEKIFHVQKFVEKPDLETAQKYLHQWEYLWNPAMFVWHVQTLLALYRKFLPKHFALIKKIQHAYETQAYDKVLKKSFSQFKPISIDYGIMERTKRMLVIPVDIGWADIGHWRSIKDVLSKSAIENTIRGLHVGVDTSGSLIYGYTKRLIATIGLSNIIIVDTPEILLVSTKEKSQEVKKIVEMLKTKRLQKYV